MKQALNHGLILKKVRRVIQFKQEASLKEYVIGNIILTAKAESDFKSSLHKFLNNSAFQKTMQNVRKQRDIKLVTTDKRRNQLVSEPIYHTTKWFSENLLAIEMKKIKVKMDKPIYLGVAILDISKTLMYKFWYDYIKPKYGNNVKLCCMDTDSFIFHVKTEDFYEDIAGDVEGRFDTSGYKFKRPLPMGKNKKELGKFKDELCGGIMREFVALRPKKYLYLTDDGNIEKKAKGTKKCVTKRKLKSIDYKKCLLNDGIILKSQQRIRSEGHHMHTEKVREIALSNNDDKRLQTYDKITTYPYDSGVGRVCKTELLSKVEKMY